MELLINGFNLNGLDNSTVEGHILRVDDQCPGNSGYGVVDVELVPIISTLYVNGEALQ
ncbi:hypothetical protein SAMN05518684_108184 [Salipaludibacillus aurantiacus]|uniref:Uncharacterized protein n=1 Tax=Salipaludibacillus aurantiacus TaxID=1601833 RepID=A0A1H9UUL0_9BACI|nr:hypothetical protein SAMN05518684_108184 [Salipaludibacillus aurantiacus]